MMLIAGWAAGKLPNLPSPREQGVTLTPVEFSFCNDYYIPDRMAAKQGKYRELLQRLRGRGYKVQGIDSVASATAPAGKISQTGRDILTIAVGHSGVILNNTRDVFGALGLPPKASQALTNSLSRLAVLRAYNIMLKKTQLEADIIKRATSAGHIAATNWGLNTNVCAVCARGASRTQPLCCCDTCHLVYHSACSCDGVDSLPDGAAWSCPTCAGSRTDRAPTRKRSRDALSPEQAPILVAAAIATEPTVTAATTAVAAEIAAPGTAVAATACAATAAVVVATVADAATAAAAAAATAVIAAVRATAAYGPDLGLLATTVTEDADAHDLQDPSDGAAEFTILNDPAHPSYPDQPAPQLLQSPILKRKHPDYDNNNIDDDDYNDHG